MCCQGKEHVHAGKAGDGKKASLPTTHFYFAIRVMCTAHSFSVLVPRANPPSPYPSHESRVCDEPTMSAPGRRHLSI